MIHVAQAGEDKGRVVLQVGSGAASPIAIDAALWLARAFQSEIESLYVENSQLLELASHPSAREISWSGKSTTTLSSASIERHFRFASAEFHERIEIRARRAEVPYRQRIIRGDPLDALATACSERGPWNVVALAEPFTSPGCPFLPHVFETVAGTTGLLIVGPHACRTTGPIVLALENAEGLPSMLAVADRLSAVQSADVQICLIADDDVGLAQLDGQARLALADRSNVGLVPSHVLRGSIDAAAELLRRLAPGLVIGQFGWLLVPVHGDIRPLALGLECPLLLVR